MALPYPNIAAAAAWRTAVAVGASANDGTGDPLRTAFIRSNARDEGLELAVDQAAANFTDLDTRTTSLEGSALFMNPRGEWVTGTNYVFTPGVRRDWFTYLGNAYVVAQTHTAGVFATDESAGRFFPSDAAQMYTDLHADITAVRTDLGVTGTGKGTQMVEHRYPGSGVDVDVDTVLDREVWVEGYIQAAGDATAWFNAALSAMAARGGGVVRFSGNYQIDGTVDIPSNVSLIGALASPGQQVPGTLADYDAFGSVLRMGASATIQLRPGAAISRALLIRSNLNMPLASAAAAATAIAAFSGTAITILGSDCRLEDLLILGFGQMVLSVDHARMRFLNVQGDCTNGFDISNCKDIPYFENCHMWPYVSANQTWTADDTTQAILTRSGTAYYLHGTVDWPKVKNCFSYGWYRGFRLNGIAAALLEGCSADGPVSGTATAHTGSIGFLFEAAQTDIQLNNCTAAGKSQGYYINATAGSHVALTDCVAVACTEGVDFVGDGDVTWTGGLLRACGYAMQVRNATANIKAIRPRIRDYTAAGPINAFVATSKFTLVDPDYAQPAGGATMVVNPGNWGLPAIASADPLHLPGGINGNEFVVTGTASIGTITGGYPRRRVTLVFTSGLTVVNGGNIRLSGSTNFTAAAGGVLELMWTGASWREIGRCV